MVELHFYGKTTEVEGYFEFFISPPIFDPYTLTPRRKISFGIQLPHDFSEENEYVLEGIAEKLKQEFWDAMKHNSFTPDPSYKKIEGE